MRDPTSYDATPSDENQFFGRAAAVVALAIGAVTLTIIGWLAIDALFLLFVGLLVAILLNSASRTLSARGGIGYGWSLAGILLAMAVAATAFVIYLVPTISEQVSQLRGELTSAANSFVQTLQRHGVWRDLLQRAQQSVSMAGGGGSTLRFVGQTVSWTVGSLLYVVIVGFFAIYFAAEPRMYMEGVTKLVPPRRRPRFRKILGDLHHTLWWWLMGTMTAMSVIGVFSAIGLYLLGIPFALPLAVLAALLTFIPNIGPTIALIPPMLLALQQGPQQALYVFLFYMTLQFVESYFVTPMIQREGAELPPVLTIGAQVIMGMLTGPLGLVVAAPLAATLMVLVKDLYVEDILGDVGDHDGAQRTSAPEAGVHDS